MAKKGKSRSGKEKAGKTGSSITVQRLKHRGSKHAPLEEIAEEAELLALDADGTLVDWVPKAARLYNKILSEDGKREVSGKYVRNVLSKVGPKRAFELLGYEGSNLEDAMNRYEQYFDIDSSDYEVIPGGMELIHEARKVGKKIALVTNADDRYARTAVKTIVEAYNDKFGTDEHAQGIFDYVRTKAGKPSGKALEEALRRTGSRSAVMIGDEHKDVAEAEETGEYSVGILGTYNSSHEFGSEPDRIAPDMSTLSKQFKTAFRKESVTPGISPGRVQTQLFDSYSENTTPRTGGPPPYHATQLRDSYMDAV